MAKRILVSDDFSERFSLGAAGTDWFYFSVDPFAADDGVASTSAQGLHVIAGGTNSSTREPAFTRTVAQEDKSGGIPGSLDRPKWFIYQSHASSRGVPGFDVPHSGELACEAWIGGKTFGTEGHPFGNDVVNANDDLRLASFLLSTIDFETLVLFDFVMTNERIYAFYERLPGAPGLGDYAAFSYAVPVAENAPGRINHLKITYDRAAGVARWLIGDAEVFHVSKIGHRLESREHMVLDTGGTETPVTLNQLDCGFGMLTFLDGYGASGRGLVRLSNAQDFYFDPSVGSPAPLEFFDDNSAEANRLFGQGAELVVNRYGVGTNP